MKWRAFRGHSPSLSLFCSGTHHETYLPAFSHPPQTHPWFSRAHENPWRPRRHQCPPCQGPQASGRLIRLIAPGAPPAARPSIQP